MSKGAACEIIERIESVVSQPGQFVPLHTPEFSGKEKAYLALPSFMVIINMAMVGARQIILFALLLFLSTRSLLSSHEKERTRTIALTVILIVVILGSGYLRFGTSSADAAIEIIMTPILLILHK